MRNSPSPSINRSATPIRRHNHRGSATPNKQPLSGRRASSSTATAATSKGAEATIFSTGKPDLEAVRGCLRRFFARHEPDWTTQDVQAVVERHGSSFARLETLLDGLKRAYNEAPDDLRRYISSAKKTAARAANAAAKEARKNDKKQMAQRVTNTNATAKSTTRRRRVVEKKKATRSPSVTSSSEDSVERAIPVRLPLIPMKYTKNATNNNLYSLNELKPPSTTSTARPETDRSHHLTDAESSGRAKNSLPDVALPEVDRLRRQLIQQSEQFDGERRKMQVEVAINETAVQQIASSLAQVQDTLQRTKRQLAEQEQEKTSLQRALTKASLADSNSSASTLVQSPNEDLHQQLEQHKRQLTETQQVNEELVQRLGLKEKEVLDLTRENEALQEEQGLSTAASTAASTARNTPLSGEMATQLNEVQLELEQKKEELATTTVTLGQCEEKVTALEHKLAEIRQSQTHAAVPNESGGAGDDSEPERQEGMKLLLEFKTERLERQREQLETLQMEKAELEETNAKVLKDKAALVAQLEEVQKLSGAARPQEECEY